MASSEMVENRGQFCRIGKILFLSSFFVGNATDFILSI